MTDREFEKWFKEEFGDAYVYGDSSVYTEGMELSSMELAWQARGELDDAKIKELETSNAYMKELSYVKDGRIKELEEKLAIKQTMPMKYKRMEFNAQLQKENDELTAKLDRAKEALGNATNVFLQGFKTPLQRIDNCVGILSVALQELDK